VNYHTLADFRGEEQKELDELFTQLLAGGAAAEGVPGEEQGSGDIAAGDEIVLRERAGTMARAFDLLAALPADLTLARRKKDKPQKRKGL
jgi:hypothetical protein